MKQGSSSMARSRLLRAVRTAFESSGFRLQTAKLVSEAQANFPFLLRRLSVANGVQLKTVCHSSSLLCFGDPALHTLSVIKYFSYRSRTAS
jgi:hypothetical protein